MSDIRQKALDLLEDLKLERDELGLQMHLAGQEIKTEWEELEHKWAHLVGQAKVAGKESQKAAKLLNADLHKAAEGLDELGEDVLKDIKHGYQRVRQALK